MLLFTPPFSLLYVITVGNFNVSVEYLIWVFFLFDDVYTNVSQPPGRSPVPGPGINYVGPREVLLEFVILVF